MIDNLDAENCSCMEGGTTDRSQELVEGCLDSLASRNRSEILRVLELDVDRRSHLIRLTNELIDPLALNCPILQTYASTVEREFRWSDIKAAAPRVDLFRSDKSPPADPSGVSIAEPPSQWRVQGRLQGRPAGGIISLQLPDGTFQEFELPFGILGNRRLQAGKEITLRYRREWRKGKVARVVKVIVRIE
ncbi:MAG: hypothetical protein AAGF89_15135 [Bacteroidota bacterium]